MTKKTRNALTDLVSKFSLDDLTPEPEKTKPSSNSKEQPSSKASKSGD